MRVGIIGAMKSEVEDLYNEIENPETTEIAGFKFFTGLIKGKEIVLLESGIGKVQAAVATALLISNFEPDFVINTGCAGGFSQDLSVGDVVISDKAAQHDVDVTALGYKPGQIPGQELYFTADEFLIEKAEKAVSDIGDLKYKKGLVLTGDIFVSNDAVASKLKEIFPEAEAVEMEGGSIAQTCFLMGVPFVIIRSLSDIAGSESKVSYEQFVVKAAKKSAELVMKMLKNM